MWLVTFADLMTLLLCFFVFLLSFSTIDENKFKDMSVSLKNSFSTQKEIPTIPLSSDPQKNTKPKKSSYHVNIVKKQLANEIKQGLISIEIDQSNIIIRINEKASFPSGSANLNTGFEPVMDKITEAIKQTTGIIHIAGHTDNIPISTHEFKSNWALAAARSITVTHYLLNNKVNPKRIVVEGYANTRPLVTNDTKQNRAKNRRVDIIISQENPKTTPIPTTIE
jgi:chemotaxis protein MotB